MAKRFVTTKVEIEGREETKVVELPSRNPEPWGEDAKLTVVGQRVTRDGRAREGHRRRALHRRHRSCRGCSTPRFFASPVAQRTRHVARPRAGARDLAACAARSTTTTCPSIEARRRAPLRSRDPLRGPAARRGVRRLARDRERALSTRFVCDVVEAGARGRHARRRSRRTRRSSASPATCRATRREITSRGDVDAGLRDADVTDHARVSHAGRAAHRARAARRGGRVVGGTRDRSGNRRRASSTRARELANAFGLPLTDVRVIKNYMGGGFGAKNGASHGRRTSPSRSSKLTGRPVRCISTAKASRPTPAIARRRCSASRSAPSATARSPRSCSTRRSRWAPAAGSEGPGRDLPRDVPLRERAHD